MKVNEWRQLFERMRDCGWNRPVDRPYHVMTMCLDIRAMTKKDRMILSFSYCGTETISCIEERQMNHNEFEILKIIKEKTLRTHIQSFLEEFLDKGFAVERISRATHKDEDTGERRQSLFSRSHNRKYFSQTEFIKDRHFWIPITEIFDCQ